MAAGPNNNKEKPTDFSTGGLTKIPKEKVTSYSEEFLTSLYSYQYELQRQNGELLRAQAELQASHAHYLDLYDGAPVGYVTLNERGAIVEVNRRATTLFAATRDALSGKTFNRSVVTEDQEIYFSHRRLLLETGTPQVCELRIYRLNSSPFWARLEMTLSQEEGQSQSRIIVVDITDRKKEEFRMHQSERQLQRSVTEKNTLIQEVHHRVKNNLQVISSLLRMQAELLKDQDASNALKECHLRILSMSLIHERLCSNSQMDLIDFADYTKALLIELFQSFGSSKNIGSRLNVSPVVLNAEQAIPCGLILNELVTNALKYAYPNGRSGEVIIDLFESRSGCVTLAVTDHGVGLPENFEWQSSKSLGLPIVDILTKQIGGTLTINTKPGASFIVEFPKSALSLAAKA